ncbi:bifunctional riboflavin kinase/FAD synthetase [Roseiterribacter gracilis]|uniref:Riboflavin biosynthesis protein n=1 Tax=Roseiterribacter gracilis TaxID=2812848 RepID=A0A8S8XC17_9PROT|nr:riboflavin biosynthesis protein [Rhodospirillales bacterium TMPK1]
MRLFRHTTDLPADARGAVVALGNFDGVHLGHREVVARAGALAREQGRPLGVVTFEPHPRSLFRPDDPPFRLTPLRPKAHALEALGVDLLHVLHFDRALSEKTAADFVSQILVGDLGIAHAVAGWDFVFGHKRGGDMQLLRAEGVRHGFGVDEIRPVLNSGMGGGGAVVSSTRVRELLQAGDARAAAALLGRPWEVDGHVLHGDARGRELGWPTANLELGEYLRPGYGIYAIRAAIDEARPVWRDGVANLGIRPMWRTAEPMIEAHLFDFAGDLYGRVLRVQLIERLREEAKFDSLEALKAQIAQDALAAQAALKK